MRVSPAVLRFCSMLVLGLALATPARSQTTPLVFVESFFNCGPSFSNGLMQVDPTTGDRRILVGLFDDGGVCTFVGSGELPSFIQWLGWDPTGAVLVADGNGAPSRVLRVSFPDGVGTVVSGCDTAGGAACSGSVIGTGPLSTIVGDVVVITPATANPPTLVDGDLVAALELFSVCGFSGSSLIRIDPATGNRTTLSGLNPDCQTTVGLGDPFVEINGIFATEDGTLLVADGDGGVGRLIEVDPATGDRTVESGCDTASGATCVGGIVGAGPIPIFAHSVVPLDAGATRVASRVNLSPGACFGGTVLEIDRATGDRSVLSGQDAACAVVGSGPPFANLEALASLPSLDVVSSEDGGVDRILRIDPSTGERVAISGCTTYSGLTCTGPTIGTGANADGYGFLTVPEPTSTGLLAAGLLSLTRRARRRTRAAAA